MEALGGGLGLLSGALSNQKEGGKDTGNIFANPQNPYLASGATQQLQAATGSIDPSQLGAQGMQNAAGAVQNSSLLGGLFGQGGTMSQTIDQEKQQANQPWQMTPEDQSMYGQMSGDIARQFGQSDQSMSQALSDRGLSNSGAAGAAFSGAQGNKMEQLAKAQQGIAQQRFQNNMQRLGQTQQFLGQLGQQAQGAQGQQYNAQSSGQQQLVNEHQQAAEGYQNYLNNYQNQQNVGLQQQQQTEHGSSLSNAINGGMQGAMAGSKMSGAQKAGG